VSLSAEATFPDQSDFDYDYETLRTTGVILAVIMFVSGILIALSKFRLVFLLYIPYIHRQHHFSYPPQTV
uniref:FXYD domain-containing ion transport regulator n=1 Tax=Myripristis murdjan TaxID=586833 RepID=A0A667Y3H5_9TELE